MNSPLTIQEVERLLRAPQKNYTNNDSTLFLVLDAGIDMLIPHMVQVDSSYIASEKKDGPSWQEKLAAIHTRANALKDRLVDFREKPEALPTKEEFHETFEAMHQWLSQDHPMGAFYRQIIRTSFKTMGVEASSKASQLTSSSKGPGR